MTLTTQPRIQYMVRLTRTVLFSVFALIAIFLAVFAVLSISYAQTTDPAIVGQWSGESPWPTVGVHMNILADGRVLTWGQDLPPSAGGVFPTYVVTIPSGSTNTTKVVRLDLDNELFCAGETFMPDGRVWSSGGQEALIEGIGIPVIEIFDPVTTSWSLGPNMSGKRWYPTATTLPNGEIVNIAGSFDENFTANRIPDVSTNHGTGMRSLTAVKNVPVDYDYPRAFVAPNGKVFIAGMEPITRYLDTSGTGAYTTVANTIDGFRGFGTAVMYDIGKVLIAGGAYDDAHVPLKTAEVINLNVATPTWRSVAPMAFARTYLNATIMADGKILISGGNSAAGEQNATKPALAAEIWDPATEKFTTVASMKHFRTYHSTAGLLPDGRVISAGSTAPLHPSLPDQLDADFYSPPYLFKGARPTISSAPALVHYGQQFTVGTPNAANISKVNWIRLSAVTHHFNFNQRINRLSFTKGTGALTVTAPPNANVCPPGHYMMFILNSNGAASVAKIVQILASGAATPTPTGARTPTPTATPTATPPVKITSPVNGATVSGTVNITMQVNSSVVWVNVYIDGKYLVSGPPYSISWKSTTVANGTHTISATANSNSGVLGTSSISIKVSNGGATPTPTPTTPVKFTAPASGATVSANVPIAVQVSAAVGWVNFYIDGSYLVSGPPYSFSWNSRTVPNGAHKISATANTNSGVIGTALVNVTVSN